MAKKLTTTKAITDEKPVTGKTKEFGTSVDGVRIRISPTGVKSFVWYYQLSNGKRGSKILGRFPDVGLDDVAKLRTKAKAELEAGVDKQTEDKPRTLGGLLDRYYTDYAVKKHKSHEATKAMFHNERWDKKKWRDIPLQRIIDQLGQPLVDISDTIYREGYPTRARDTLNLLRTVTGWAATFKYLPETYHPTMNVRYSIIGEAGAEQRDRVLSDDEIKAIWAALDDYKRLHAPTRIGLKLLLITGLRSGELRQSQWSAYDKDASTLTIPISLQKTGKKKGAKDFIVPLPPLAVTLIEELKAITGGGVYMFPSESDNEKSLVLDDKVFGHAVRRLRERMKKAENELERWTPHDLRRTMRSNLTELGIDLATAETCLNHSLNKFGSTISTYDVSAYLDKRKEALVKWANHLTSLVNPKPTLEIVKNA